MGCTLSVNVANPQQEEALQKQVEELSKTVENLQQIIDQQQGNTNNLSGTFSVNDENNDTPLQSKTAIPKEEALEQTPSVSDISIHERGREDDHGIVKEHDAVAADGEAEVPLRVQLKPTEVVTHLLQSAHMAETNALEHLLTTTRNPAEATEAWQAYRAFRQKYDSLLHGGEEEAAEGKTNADEDDNQEGGLLHFLGLPDDLDDKPSEAADYKAIEDCLDWRDDAGQAMGRYRDARLAHLERVEDEIIPRLEALQAAVADQEAADQNKNDGNAVDLNDADNDVDLNEMTKSVLFTHVLNPFCEDTVAFESFVCYVTRALERTGPNKKAIRPFQNAIKAMASSTEQADLYKSWITHTRKTGILSEQKAAHEWVKAAATMAVFPTTPAPTRPVPPTAVEQPQVPERPATGVKAEETANQLPVVQEQAPPAQAS